MKSCYVCGGKMEEGVDLVFHKGKTIPQKVQKCIKCGKSVVSIDSYEEVRKQIHPSFIGRVKSLFSSKTDIVDVFKGKVL